MFLTLSCSPLSGFFQDKDFYTINIWPLEFYACRNFISPQKRMLTFTQNNAFTTQFYPASGSSNNPQDQSKIYGKWKPGQYLSGSGQRQRRALSRPGKQSTGIQENRVLRINRYQN